MTLIERLRDSTCLKFPSMALEAADRIEALEAENAALLAVAKSARDYIEQAIAERVRSFGENYRPSTLAVMRKELADCDAAIDAARGKA
jgi:uncharacterized pyridoxal phosphate-containing UPF0001 family protein